MKTELELEKFSVQLFQHDIENLRTRAEVEGKNTPEVLSILRQIDGELERLAALEAAETAPEHAQLSEVKYIKNEVARLVHKLESELSSDKTSKYLHKLLAKLRG